MPRANRAANWQTFVCRALLFAATGLSLAASHIFIRAWTAFTAEAQTRPAEGASQVEPRTPTYVGAPVCGACHQSELKLWTGSHHELAMQQATAATVLGDFGNSTFNSAGQRATFSRSGDKFFIRTAGSDGTVHDFPVGYTFGVYPLQQYLIAMPGGRLQAFGIAWDSRPKNQRGQRWVFLYPGKRLSSADDLYWSGIDQNWNYMCADCHSTNLRKGYDPATRTYATTFAAINVSCEACHGPGSKHVDWAKRSGQQRTATANLGLTIVLNERKGVAWTIDPVSGKPRRSRPRDTEREIQMCARCHSRRGAIHVDYVHGQALGDDYRVALLDADLYFPDGQIKGEVYEYGSFIQSRMFHAGVMCSDCHEPHSLRLRAEGNAVCLQCHSASQYDSPKHSFHPLKSNGARCVECHMPERTYMVVDRRRDHSIRIPRPDLSAKLGTPNACNNCHLDKSPQWASKAIHQWYKHSPDGFQSFAETLQNGLIGAPGAQQALGALAADHDQPAIARATAMALMAPNPSHLTDMAAKTAAADQSPLLRRAAAEALTNADGSDAARILDPNLYDRIRDVRAATAEALAGVSMMAPTSEDAKALSGAIDDYVAAQRLNADRPEAHLNLGILFAKQRKFEDAEAEFKTALGLDPYFAPAAVDLADLYRVLNRDAAAEGVLRQSLRRSPHDAGLLHALGLLMVRENRRAAAQTLLAEAAKIAPDDAHYVFVYAVALNDSGQKQKAIETLERSLAIHPYDRETLEALAVFTEKAGETERTRIYERRLEQLAVPSK